MATDRLNKAPKLVEHYRTHSGGYVRTIWGPRKGNVGVPEVPKYAKKCQNPARRPKNDPPSGQTATYRKTEVIQSCLRIWGTYDPIESGPYDPKKMGVS